jgi:chorismate lyase
MPDLMDISHHWAAPDQLGRLTDSPEARSWLLERGSLTLRLKRQHPGLAVRIVAEGLGPLLPDETIRLTLPPHRQAWVREVTLHDGSLELLQARTVIPDWSSANPWSELQRLGNRPLGEILFSDSGLERSEFEFTLGPGWRAAETPPAPDRLARRCVYRRLGAPLLLTERFLRIEP